MKVAEGMESQFINHMINEMKKSVNKNQPMNQAQSFYNSKMDEEYAKIMSETKSGLGLKEMIIEQLAPQYIRKIKLAKTYKDLEHTKNRKLTPQKEVVMNSVDTRPPFSTFKTAQQAKQVEDECLKQKHL